MSKIEILKKIAHDIHAAKAANPHDKFWLEAEIEQLKTLLRKFNEQMRL